MLIHTWCPAQEKVDAQATKQQAALNETVLPGLEITYSTEPSEYCLFTVLTKEGYDILNIFAPNGEHLFYRKIFARLDDFKILSNGYLSHFDNSRKGYIFLDSLYQEIDSIKMLNDYKIDWHAMRVDKDGGYFMTGSYYRDLDMDELVEGGYSDARVREMIIQKVDADNNVVFEWNTADHFNVTDTYNELTNNIIDYVHFNSIEIDTDSSSIISCRNMSELSRIDLNTGNIIWRLGGKNNQFILRNFDREFSGQHTLRKKTDSTYTIYDNGNFVDSAYSMGVEFRIDEDSMIAEQLHIFRHEPDVFAPHLGNVQNMDNGNTLVYWGFTNKEELGGFYSEYNEAHVLVQKGSFINSDIPVYHAKKFKWNSPLLSTDAKLNHRNAEAFPTSYPI